MSHVQGLLGETIWWLHGRKLPKWWVLRLRWNLAEDIKARKVKVFPGSVTTTLSLVAEGPMGERHELDIANYKPIDITDVFLFLRALLHGSSLTYVDEASVPSFSNPYGYTQAWQSLERRGAHSDSKTVWVSIQTTTGPWEMALVSKSMIWSSTLLRRTPKTTSWNPMVTLTTLTTWGTQWWLAPASTFIFNLYWDFAGV